MAGSPKKRARRQQAEEHRIQLPAVIPPPPEPEPPKDRFGRPTKFRPEYVEEARILCEEGATNPELAEHFGVSVSTIHLWRHAHPEFAAVILSGKRAADDRVERTLYELATGFTMTVTEHIKVRQPDGSEVIAERSKDVIVPPNPDAVKFWLKNRRPDDWKDKTEQHRTGTVDVVHITVEQRRERVKGLLQSFKQKELGTE